MMTASGIFFCFSDFNGFEDRESMETLDKGMSVNISLDVSDKEHQTASERRRWRGVKDPSSHEIRLENAVLLGRWQEVKFLIEAGVDVSHCDDWILRMATFAGEVDMIRFLVERGADPLAMKPSEVRQAAQITQSALSKVGARSKLGMNPSSPIRAIEREPQVRFSLSAPAYMM